MNGVVMTLHLKGFILQIMKMEHINLFEEALAYKKCAAEISEASSTIQSKSMLT